MKSIPNMITIIRIILSILIPIIQPFSILFWVIYVVCGLSDILDGFIARKWRLESCLGAKLDSIADFIFAVSLCIVILRNIKIPMWLWICILIIALLRFTGYLVGYCKFKTLVSVHTYANKVTGFALFTAPILIFLCGLNTTGVLLCVIAGASTVEEIAILTKSRQLDRNQKGLFFHDKQE